MSPHEVAGLNYLAKKQGTKLTINPHTGLPEAFSLGGFFKSLLPMFVGAATGGAGMPLWAGIAAGAATGAVTSDDPLMGAVTGGLGGYGGFGLGQGLFAAGAPSAIPGAAGSSGIIGSTGEMGSSLLNASRGIAPGAASATANAAGNAYNLADTAVNTSGLAAGNVNPALANLKNVANTSGFTASAGTGATGIDKSFLGGMDRIGPGIKQMGTGIKNIATSEPGAWDAFKASFAEPGAKPISDLAAYGKIGMPIGGAALGGLEPSDIYGEPINMDDAKKKQAYDPYSRLNLGNDTGLRLVAEGGYIDGYAVGGTVNTSGINDIYSSLNNPTTPELSRDGYGVGRLNDLASQQSLDRATVLGYAMGGPVSFADGGDTNPLTEEIQPIDQSAGIASLTPQVATSQAMPVEQAQNMATALSGETNSEGSIISQVAANLRANPNYQPKNPIEAAIVKQMKGTDPMQQGQPSPQGLGSLAPSQPMAPSYNPSQSMAPSFNPSVAMGPTYFAGMNTPQGYAEGGYLNGQGDGMSDSIPATIEGKQPARLADGEFVVPADVVSHIGNGSSKAGSKRLYAMLDKVRHARTGNKKQGKQINPAKYMPA